MLNHLTMFKKENIHVLYIKLTKIALKEPW